MGAPVAAIACWSQVQADSSAADVALIAPTSPFSGSMELAAFWLTWNGPVMKSWTGLGISDQRACPRADTAREIRSNVG